MGDLFEIKGNPPLNKDSFTFSDNGEFPYFTRTVFNNGFAGYVDYLDEEHKIKGGCLAIGMISMQFFYMAKDFYAGQFTKRAIPKKFSLTERIANYFIASLNKNQKTFQNCLVRNFEGEFNTSKIKLPIKNGEIDFDFMEEFIAELEAYHIAELEAYLQDTGLKDYILTAEEQRVLEALDNGEVAWGEFNLKKFFGESTRGKRLKSADRITGNLPFVTAGESEAGVSAYIGNKVEIFKKNTITIDVFGSAKYRNYDYGADDHVVVVHTEQIPKCASLFVTTSIHKTAYTGGFHYGRKFCAKDADKLNVSLPIKNNQPDYDTMETLISAVQKMVIKEVVLYSEQKMTELRQALG